MLTDLLEPSETSRSKKSIARQQRKLERIATKSKTMMIAPKQITPLTNNQSKTMQSFRTGKNMLLMGSAGTGKTFLSLYLALDDVMNQKSDQERVIIVRSATATVNQGFLPGNLQKKSEVYEAPYYEICAELFGRKDAYENLKAKGIIEFVTTSFIRGTTFHNAIVLLDEYQNCNLQEITTVITRVGEGTRLILSGDVKQNDLSTRRNLAEQSGADQINQIFRSMPSVDIIEFGINDIVRSKFVKEFLITKERLGL